MRDRRPQRLARAAFPSSVPLQGAYLAGARARAAGLGPGACPYKKRGGWRSVWRRAWMKGWAGE